MKVLYFSSVTWRWIKQRPHFLSYYLANKHIQVDYFSITPVLKQRKGKVQKINSYLRVMDSYVLPLSFKCKIIQNINIAFVQRKIKENYDVVILTHPMQYLYLSDRIKKHTKIIYECMDNIPFFYEGALREKIINMEYELCKVCDAIIVSSEYLYSKIVDIYGIHSNKIKVIKNAVDISFINEKVERVELKHPNLMYIGTIDDWIDYESIQRFAERNPRYTIYLIGPATRDIKNKIGNINGNIQFLGTISHDLVKSYILEGDIMLIPFKVNELIKGVDPVKLYEYLAVKKYIISSYWEELKEYKDSQNVFFYTTESDFENQVKLIMDKEQKEPEVDIDFIRANSWEVRVEDYIKVLEIVKDKGCNRGV